MSATTDNPSNIKSFPRITVITVVRNGVLDIERTIRSVLSQNYPNLEYIIVDGASTDGTQEIIRSFEAQGICWSSEPDGGIYEAMNKGIAKSTSDLIGLMNCGDEYLPGALQAVADSYDADQSGSVYYGDVLLKYLDAGLEIPATGNLDELNVRMSVPHQASFVSKNAYDNFGTYSEKWRLAGDYDCFLRFFREGLRFIHVPHRVAIFVGGGAGDREAYRIELIKIQREQNGSVNWGALPKLGFEILLFKMYSILKLLLGTGSAARIRARRLRKRYPDKVQELTTRRDPNKPLLSLVVPTMRQSDELLALFRSVGEMNAKQTELVLVNQSGATLRSEFRNGLDIPLVEIQPTTRLSGSAARNLGAANASGEFLFFLDEDAICCSGKKSLENLLEHLSSLSGVDAVAVSRGVIREGSFVEHFAIKPANVSLRNFPRFVIEWNIIIRRANFVRLGGFPAIGTGSDHAAQSGEAHVLSARLLSRHGSFSLFPEVQIAHPDLFATAKKVQSILGYGYGAGFSVGITCPEMGSQNLVYWVMRAAFASVLDAFFRSGEQIVKPAENILLKKFRRRLGWVRFQGLWDGLLCRKPRSTEWLVNQGKGLLECTT